MVGQAPAPDAAELARAVNALRAGDLVAFPTETVYGLGADASNPRAVEKLYAVKGRPAGHPVIVHLAHADQLDEFALDLSSVARELARSCWPGPLTLVVARNPERVAPQVTGGRDTVGLRVPDHPLALALLDAFGGGVAAPSANRFGKVSPTTAAHVHADLGADVSVVIDGGPCRVGIESTIVDVSGGDPVILRIGGVSPAEIERITGRTCALSTAGEIAAPGTLSSHYAPRASVEIADPSTVGARAAELLEAGRRVGLLSPESAPLAPVPEPLVVLGRPLDVEDFGRVLYARLREADQLELDVLLVVLPPDDHALGAAVADRVRRAAH